MGLRRPLQRIALSVGLIALAVSAGGGFPISGAQPPAVPEPAPDPPAAGRSALSAVAGPLPASTATPARPPSTAPSLALSAAPAPTPPPPAVTPSPRRTRAALRPEPVAAIVRLTNEVRAGHGLPPLVVSPILAAAALDYARTMATSAWFAHESPDGSPFTSRAEAAGYTGWLYLGENLYYGPIGRSPKTIVEAWVASPAHLDVMLNEAATEIGVGCYPGGGTLYCAQEFGDR